MPPGAARHGGMRAHSSSRSHSRRRSPRVPCNRRRSALPGASRAERTINATVDPPASRHAANRSRAPASRRSLRNRRSGSAG
ncbi:hypothetical protein DB771_08095 [Burkholderia sp. AU29985]|nr:hypothetical protein EGY28_03255 [Burkholderia dolosa]PRE43272.1 hypothetical protein C6P87_25045 [Burkholderia sp. AU12872]PUA77354.1 hypothetical protein DB771_08095 [Burkholderia sp. AU29985]